MNVGQFCPEAVTLMECCLSPRW